MKIAGVIKKYALFILILFHLVGLLGISFGSTRFFAGLTPLNLLLSLGLIVLCHNGDGKRFTILLVFVFITGFLVELLGVQTGFPFGDYRYLTSLGPKLLKVPVVIGLNWFLLVIGAGFLAKTLIKYSLGQVLLAALAMVLIDAVIEPVAPHLHYWAWHIGHAPLVNYLGWFAVSVLMQTVFQLTVKNHSNPLAIPYVVIVGVFFLILNITL